MRARKKTKEKDERVGRQRLEKQCSARIVASLSGNLTDKPHKTEKQRFFRPFIQVLRLIPGDVSFENEKKSKFRFRVKAASQRSAGENVYEILKGIQQMFLRNL